MNPENLFVLFLTLVFVMGVTCWFKARARREGDPRSVARTALDGCQCLVGLIAHMQQHRGMSSAHLAGDHGFDRRLVDKRAEIRPLLNRLQQVADAESASLHPCFTHNDFVLFRHRWESLVQDLDGMSLEASISVHSQLISTLLGWLDALGEARIELPLSHSLPVGCVRNFAHRLPQLSEYLGQARATGSGVAAKGNCSAVARVRLMFLVSRAESLVEQACAVNQHGHPVEAKVRSLAQLTRALMLASQHVDVTAAEYFAEASGAIDAVFAWIDEYSHELQSLLAMKA